jgi:hypothetical protein
MNIYYITVKFTGSPYVPPSEFPDDNETEAEPLVKTGITFNITDITWKSKGRLSFS